jgi:hypothetical protein
MYKQQKRPQSVDGIMALPDEIWNLEHKDWPRKKKSDRAVGATKDREDPPKSAPKPDNR